MTLEALIKEMDKQANASGDEIRWWQQAALILKVWSSCTNGWFPTSSFDPRNNRSLEGLAKAYRLFGSDLVHTANFKAFAA